jgi:hypothetical protein
MFIDNQRATITKRNIKRNTNEEKSIRTLSFLDYRIKSTDTNTAFLCNLFDTIFDVMTIQISIRMNSMFKNNVTFNEELNWDTSQVIDMSNMFNSAQNFNSATIFDGSTGAWDTRQVTTMESMFQNADNFNCGQPGGDPQDLMQRTAYTGWRVDNVTNMDNMFNSAQNFNGNISDWCTTLITSTPSGFADNTSGSWDTSRQPTWGSCPYPN